MDNEVTHNAEQDRSIDSPLDAPLIFRLDSDQCDNSVTRRTFLSFVAVDLAILMLGCHSGKSTPKPTPPEDDLSSFYDKMRATKSAISGLFLTSDNQQLITVGSQEIKIWNWASGGTVRNALVGSRNQAFPASAFCASQNLLATVTTTVGELLIWSIPDGDFRKISISGHQGYVGAVDISDDGTKVVTCDWTKGSMPQTTMMVRVWSVASGNVLYTYYFDYFISSISFSKDGGKLAVGLRDGTVVMIDLASNSELWRGKHHGSDVTKSPFSLDGQLIMSGDWDGKLSVVDAATGTQLLSFVGHDGPVSDIVFMADNKSAATCGYDGKIVLWKVSDGAKIAELDTGISRLTGSRLAFDSLSELLLAGGGGRVMILKLPTLEVVSKLVDPGAVEKGLDYRYYYSLDNRGRTLMYSLPSNRSLPANNICTCDLVQGAFEPSGGGDGGCNPYLVCTCIPVWW